MRILWWIPVAAAVIGAGAWFRARRKRQRDVAIASGTPVSEQWLAQARGREEHQL
jgi:cytochrome c-type biogenesis protein CcmH/NrfF